MPKSLPNYFIATLAASLAKGGSESEVYIDSLTTIDNQAVDITAWAQENSVGTLIVDPQSSGTVEYVKFTGVDTSGIGFTGITRGLSTLGDGASIAGNKQFHPVGATVIIGWSSNDLANFMDLYTSQTIATGVKTFSVSPVVPTGGTGTQAANHTDISNAITGFTGTATASVAGTTKLSINPTVTGTPVAAGANNTQSGTAISSGNNIVDEDYLSTVVIPSGVIQMYAVATAPTGWLLCDGTSYLQATYPSLFTAIGTTFGSADGSHFNVPDLRGRIPIGQGTGIGGGSSGSGNPTGGAGLTARVLGAWAGEETHTLTSTEMPSHTHTVSNILSTNSYQGGSLAGYTATTGTLTTGSAGSGGAHNNLQPFTTLAFIIKT